MTKLARARARADKHRATLTRATSRLLDDGRNSIAGKFDLFVMRMSSILLDRAERKVRDLEAARMPILEVCEHCTGLGLRGSLQCPYCHGEGSRWV